MSKKQYLLNLNKEDVEDLRTWLEPQGISFSGYISMVVSEQMTAIRKIIEGNKTPSLTASSLLKVAGKMAEEIEEDVKKKSKKAKR